MDKDVARQLATDLKNLGHKIWLDEWEIQVGQCIPTEIEKGITDANFLIVLLSNHAVNSTWVEREWKTAYWDEVNQNSVLILPACIEQCKIPKLLQTKKYASLFKSYDYGFREIVTAINHYTIQKAKEDFYAVVDRVRAQVDSTPDELKLMTNEHWDRFQTAVESLGSQARAHVQKLNTLHYLQDYGLTVKQLKEQLRQLDFFDGELDDRYTAEVADSLVRFQKMYNLRHVDGVFGPLTYLRMAEVAGFSQRK